MIGLLVVTHGAVAEELVSAARRIVKDTGPIAGLALDWDHDVEELRQQIEAKVAELDEGEGLMTAAVWSRLEHRAHLPRPR